MKPVVAQTAKQFAVRLGWHAMDPAWAQVWQLPVLLLGMGVLTVGVWTAMPTRGELRLGESLDEAGQYIAAGNYQEATARLRVLAEPLNGAEDDLRARYEQYLADVRYGRLAEAGLVDVASPVTREELETVVVGYGRSRELGRSLPPAVLSRWARALTALGQGDEAAALVDAMGEGEVDRRLEVLRAVIEPHLDEPRRGDTQRLARLLDQYASDARRLAPGPARQEAAVWVTLAEAKLRLETGDPRGAADHLLRHLPRLLNQGDEAALAPLRVLLGDAYARIGDDAAAEQQYLLAQQHAPANHPVAARALVGLAGVAMRNSAQPNHLELAHSLYDQVTRDFPGSDPAIDALIGLGHVLAGSGRHDEAQEAFQQAVKRLLDSTKLADPRRTVLVDTVRAQVDAAVEREQYEPALAYLAVLDPMKGGNGHTPEAVLPELARAHERRGEQIAARGEAADVSLEARRRYRLAAAVHFEKAGAAYRQHAASLAARAEPGDGEALWHAAICFDRALRADDAADAFARIIRTHAGDRLELQARSRLGRSLLAQGHPEAALEQFRALEAASPNSEFHFETLVPRARAYLALNDTGAAERTLLSVVDNHPVIGPDSDTYREALIELGELHHRLGVTDSDPIASNRDSEDESPAVRARHVARALDVLEEAHARYADTPAGPAVAYLLADTYRCSAVLLNRPPRDDADLPGPAADPATLAAEADARLVKAQALYTRAIAGLEARDPSTLTQPEQLQLRNSYFYRGDAAYERGQFREAIDLYTNAARRYGDDAASLAALVQIVNAHCALGEYGQARAANQRALAHLERTPDSAFEDPTLALPMDRKHWEDWLRWSAQGGLFDATAAVDAP